MANDLIDVLPFGTGCFPDPFDGRDKSYDDHILGAPPVVIDWVKGYDVREHLGFDLPYKNQFSSGSCVGQGWSYYLAIINAVETGVMTPDSAKAFYSQINIGWGAYIRDGAKLICEWGGVGETIVPSLKENGTTDEEFMKDLAWKNSQIDELAKILQGKDYRVINAVSNMDLFAQAVLQNHGVVGGVNGSNNGTWTSERPQPPIGSAEWGHCLYFGAFGTDEFGKFIATPNSWGNLLGKIWKPGSPVGYGWQKLYQNYFDNQGINIFNPWTYTDKPNNFMNTNVKVIKDSATPAVGFWCPANNPDGLIAMARNYGIEIPYKADKISIDWDKLIQGTMTLK